MNGRIYNDSTCRPNLKRMDVENDYIKIDRIKPGSKYPYHISGKYGEIGWTDIPPKTKK